MAISMNSDGLISRAHYFFLTAMILKKGAYNSVNMADKRSPSRFFRFKVLP